MGSHRTSLQILADILAAVKGGAKKTRIMYQANLSFRLLTRYLRYALETELVSPPCSGNDCYKITPKGYSFLEEYSKYSMRSVELEEQKQVVTKEKAVLEENYVAKMNNAGQKSPYPKQLKAE